MIPLIDKFMYRMPRPALQCFVNACALSFSDHARTGLAVTLPNGLGSITFPAALRAISETRIMLNGFKYVNLSGDQAEMFARTDPTVKWSEYRQPYDEIIVKATRKLRTGKDHRSHVSQFGRRGPSGAPLWRN